MSDDIFDMPGASSKVETVPFDLPSEDETKAVSKSSPSAPPVPSVPKQSSYQEGRIGDVVTRFPIPRMKFSEGHPEFIVPCTDEVFFVRYHFFQGLGYVFCNGSVCCRNDKIPPVRVAIPVFRLTRTAAEVKYIQLGEDDYNGFVEKWKERGTLVGRLIKVRCTDAQFQKIDVDILDKTPFKEQQDLWKQLMDFYQANKQSIKPSIARVISDEDLAEFLGVEVGTDMEDDSFFG